MMRTYHLYVSIFELQIYIKPVRMTISEWSYFLLVKKDVFLRLYFTSQYVEKDFVIRCVAADVGVCFSSAGCCTSHEHQ